MGTWGPGEYLRACCVVGGLLVIAGVVDRGAADGLAVAAVIIGGILALVGLVCKVN